MNTSNRLSRYKPSVWFVIAILCHTLPSISSEGLLMIKNTEPPITLLPTGQTFPLNQASLLNGEILTENEDNLPTDGSTTIEPGSLEREEVIVSPFKSVAMDQVQSPDIGETTVTSTSPTTTESIVATPTEDSTINLSTQNHTTTTSRLHKATTDQPLAASTLSSVDSLKTQEVDSSTVTVSQPSTMETTGQLPHRTEQVSTLQSVELTTESSLEFTTPNNFLISTMSEDQTAATKNEQDLKETKFTQFATTMTPTLATESIKSTTETSTKASTSQNTESNANLSFKSQFATPSLVKEAEPVTESLNVQDSEFITATSSDESAVKTFEPPQDVNSSTAKDAETTTFKLNTTSTTVQPSSTEFLNETLTKFDSIQQDLKKPTTEVLFEAQPTSATTAVIDAGVATESVLKQTTVQKIEAFTTQKSEELTISNNADLTTRPSSSSLQPIMATNVNVSTESSTQSATINNLNSTKDNGLEFVTMTESKFSTATTPSSTFEASLGSLETERLVSTAQPATESMTETNFKLTTSTTTERFATPSIETSTQATNDEMSRPNENGGFRNFDNTEFVSKFATNPTTTANESNVDFVANELSPSDVTSTTSSTIPVVFPTTFPDPFNVPINSTPNEVSNVPVLFPINPPPVVPGIVSRPKNLAETTLTIDELFNMNANMIKTFNHQPKPLSRIPNLPPRVVFPANMPVRFPTPQEDARSRTNEIPLPKNVTLPGKN